MDRSAGEADFTQGLDLLKGLITLHPAYGCGSQALCAEELAIYMRAQSWRDVTTLDYTSADLEGIQGYVKAFALGGMYSEDRALQKRNVVARAKSGDVKRTLIINGHYDVDVVTAPQDWCTEGFWSSACLDGDKLYGRGATDMLGGLCMTLAAASNFVRRHEGWDGQIIVMAVTDEEIGGNGTLQALDWLEQHAWTDQCHSNTECIIAEPSEGRLCSQSLGFAQCYVSVDGEAGHAGSMGPASDVFDVGYEAVQALSAAVGELADACEDLCTEDSWSVNIGKVRCGEDASIRPVHFSAEGIILYPAVLGEKPFQTELAKIFHKSAPQRARLNFGEFGFEGAVFGDTRLTEIVQKQKWSYLHVDNPLFRSPCDARLFDQFGIDCVICGPGSLEQAHTTDEFIKVSDLRAYFNDTVTLIEKYFGK